jgi:cell division protein FtsN
MAKTEQGSSKMDTVLKMLLIAFVSLLAFSSGVYFGKQMSDSDHQLKALESDFNTQSTLTAENGEGAAKPGEEQMGEQEVATLSDKYVNAEKETAKRDVASTEKPEVTEHVAGDHVKPTEHGTERVAATHTEVAKEHAAPAKAATHETAHQEKVAPKAAAHDEEAASEENEHVDHAEHEAVKAPAHSAMAAPGKPDLSAAHRAAERVANNASPVTTKQVVPAPANRIPTSLPKTVGANGSVEFTVQVASYPTSDAAKSYANDLVKKGFPAFPVEANINGRTWYRVSVGSFKTMKDATVYRAQLLKQADLQNAIVQKITR